MCGDIMKQLPPDNKQPSMWECLHGGSVPRSVEPLAWLLAESVFAILPVSYVTRDVAEACIAVAMAMNSLPHLPVPTGPNLTLCEDIFRNIKTVSGDVLRDRYPEGILDCTGWGIHHVPWRVIQDRMIYLNP